MIKKCIPIFIVLLLAEIAASALFGARFIPTHDGEYHIIRFWQFYEMLQSGNLIPRWAPDLNSGYGLPLFIFHYPFPNYIGAFFHFIGFSFVDGVKLTLASGYLLAVFWCYMWIRAFGSKYTAMCASIIFAYVPYWFVDMYVRGSVGEVWAVSFVMLSLVAIERKWPIVISLAIAGVVISHNITALFCVPLLCAYAVARSKVSLLHIMLGIMSASYFWLPALMEAKYMVGLSTVNYIDHFPDLSQLLIPSWGTGFSGPGKRFDQMSFQVGIAPLVVYFIAIILAFRSFQHKFIIGIVLLYTAVLYCMTAESIWLWEMFPFLQYIQFPWRLLTVLMILTALLAGFIVEKIPKWVSISIVMAAIVFSFGYTRPVKYNIRYDAHYLTLPHFTDGTSSLDNSFSTIWTGWKKERFASRFVSDHPRATISALRISGVRYVLDVFSDEDHTMTANILYYPGWVVKIDGKVYPASHNKDGVIYAAIPKGSHTVEVYFTQTPLRSLADGLSIVSLFCVFGSGILGAVYAYRAKQLTTFDRTQSSRGRNIHKRAHIRTPKRS